MAYDRGGQVVIREESMSSLVPSYAEDEYRFTSKDGLVAIRMGRFRVDPRAGMRAEVEVRWHGQPKPGLLKSSDLNLNASNTIKQWANELESRAPDHDWYATLTAAAYLAKERYRTGDPPIRMSEVDTAPGTRWVLRPLLEASGPTVVAAKGGSLKSLLALAAMLTVVTGRGKFLGVNAQVKGQPGLYLDWEADRHTHRNRLDALCRGAGVDLAPAADGVFYRREYAPLHETANELVRYVRDIEPGIIVIDSKGASLSGAPEDAETTLRFFRAVRQLGVPALIVDHVTNEAADGKGAKRPFGSVYTQNIARNVWYAEKADEAPGEVTVMWKHIKSNNGAVGKRLAWRVELDMDDGNDLFERIRIEPVSPVVVSQITEGDTSLRGMLRRILTEHTAKGEFLSVRELVSLTGHSEASVRARLNEGRMDNEFLNSAKSGEAGRWLLASGISATVSELPAPF